MSSSPMSADDWFEKRHRIAARFGVAPSTVLPETVWYLSEDPSTGQDIVRGQAVWNTMAKDG